MDAVERLPQPMPATDAERKLRLACLGLEQGDLATIRTIMGASSRLASRYELTDCSDSSEVDVLVVNGDSGPSLEGARLLRRHRRDMRILLLGGDHRDAGALRRPVSPRMLETALLPPAASTGQDQTTSPNAQPARPRGLSAAALRILIVDDSLPAREFIRLKIEALGSHQAGLDLSFAESGEDAIARFMNDTFDLVFLDVEMPGMDGFATCRELKKRHPGLRVVMLTSKSLSQDYQRGREVGCNHYLTKPPLDNDVKTILTLASLKKTTG